MGALKNLDLFSSGIAVVAIAILGFTVYLNNRKSITNKAFLFFSLAAVFWNIFNYLIFQFTTPDAILWVLRTHIFFAVFYSFGLFLLFYVFPREEVTFSKLFRFILIPTVFLVAFMNITSLTFTEIGEISAEGRVAKVINGPGIFIFGFTVMILIISGIYFLVRKMVKAVGEELHQLREVAIGTALTFVLHIIFNFILPAFYDNPRFVPFGAVFTFPLIVFTAHAIIKHKFLNVKVLAAEILTFVLVVATFIEVILSDNLLTIIFRSGVLLLVFGFGILLIKSVIREVEQRERLEVLTKELEAANVRLTELDKLKSEFLSFASHQVKSPMSVVKGFAQLIYDGTYGKVSEQVKETAHKIKESADRMIALVNNLLDLRKIEEGKMEYKFENIDIVAFVSGMANEYKMLALNKGLEIKFESDKPSIIIKADSEKIRQVIQNLIDNSIKYTDKGFMKLNVKDEGDNVLIEITDTGRGMSKEMLNQLFQRFVRDQNVKREIQGTGLGLYIAKEIVTAHHGDIWAESDGENRGSRFFVRLRKE